MWAAECINAQRYQRAETCHFALKVWKKCQNICTRSIVFFSSSHFWPLCLLTGVTPGGGARQCLPQTVSTTHSSLPVSTLLYRSPVGVGTWPGCGYEPMCQKWIWTLDSFCLCSEWVNTHIYTQSAANRESVGRYREKRIKGSIKIEGKRNRQSSIFFSPNKCQKWDKRRLQTEEEKGGRSELRKAPHTSTASTKGS